MKMFNRNVYERLVAQRLVTIAEVVNSLYAINPNTKTKDLSEEYIEEIQETRKAVIRNIRYLNIRVASVNEEINADLAFAAAYDYLMEEITPEEIIERVKEGVIAFHYSNDWQEYMMAFGGRTLVELVAQVRKSGRGQHRKSDEEDGTFKMMGLLLQLLAQKHPTKKYGSYEKPTISEIYNDVLVLIENGSLTTKGVGKSTFSAKASLALRALIDNE